MQKSPVCRICNDHKRLPLSKLACCWICKRTQPYIYVCMKHLAKTPPGTPCLCVECFATQNSESKKE